VNGVRPLRIVVVGSGVIGLLTAMECVRLGAEVSLVDSGDIPSPEATSYDRQRVVRALHRGDASLTRAAAGAHRGWQEVERRTGTHFYHQVGSLTAMAAQSVRPNLAVLAEAGVPARALSGRELAERHPWIRFPEGSAAVFEPDAGVVLADRALTAMADWLRGRPTVTLYPRRRVVGFGAGVQLADGTEVPGDKVVVAAGPRSRELLPAALSDELTLYRQSMLSYRPLPSRVAWIGTPAMPSLGTSEGAWLIPPVADTLLRLSASNSCRAVDELTDRQTSQYWRDQLTEQFSRLLVGFDPAGVVGATDGYYLGETGGTGPLLATFAGELVWAYAACGGMSFKFAPLVARALADRALGRPPRSTGIASIDRPRRFADARREEMTP
jgi:glycine/D-amino acid oxidase-like deaminating enzyme